MLGVALVFFGAYATWFALESWWTIKSGRLGPLRKLTWRRPPPKWGVERISDRLETSLIFVAGLALIVAGLFVGFWGE